MSKDDENSAVKAYGLGDDDDAGIEAFEKQTWFGGATAQTTHVAEPDQDEFDERELQKALDPNQQYFDATPAIQALCRKVRKQDATIQRLATLLEGFARRQVAMNTKVVELHEAHKQRQSKIIVPDYLKN